jgi:urease beta subunit
MKGFINIIDIQSVQHFINVNHIICFRRQVSKNIPGITMITAIRTTVGEVITTTSTTEIVEMINTSNQ